VFGGYEAGKLLISLGVPNAQLEQFIHALEAKAVPFLIFGIVVAALLGGFLKWIENWLIRAFRSARAARQSKTFPASSPVAGFLPTPPCPICNSQMVKRTARRGSNAGQQFWGCSNYPNCRGTRPI
jgi:uncharacterized membrane protein YraQ (UPF0718 family)